MIVHGEVADALEYEAVCRLDRPLCSGGGMRVKILEGMALGKLVITTSLGAEGIQVTNGKKLWSPMIRKISPMRLKYYLDHPRNWTKLEKLPGNSSKHINNNEQIAMDLLEIYRRKWLTIPCLVYTPKRDCYLCAVKIPCRSTWASHFPSKRRQTSTVSPNSIS